MKSTRSWFHVLILVSLLVLAGCSGRQIYQSAAGWRLNECQKILEDAERARCMEQANKDYDTYSKERNASPEQR
jgi:hypothetical protein